MVAKKWVKTQIQDSTLIVDFAGDFRAFTAREVDPLVRQIDLSGIKSAVINLKDLGSFDTTGAWIIERFLRTLLLKGIKYEIQGESTKFKTVLEQIEKFRLDLTPEFYGPPNFMMWLEYIGIRAHKVLINAYHMLSFLGELTYVFLRCIRYPHKIRIVAVTAILNRVGLNALPIVGMISFLLGVVLVYQSAYQLRKFGAEILTVDLLAISFLREIGILLTAIMVAGRSGSAFAAQIGTMKLNQEIDALLTFGISPIEVLVVPRVIGLIIVMPLLAFFSDMIGLLGGMIMCKLSLGISYNQFSEELLSAITKWTFWVGIIKAPFFGFIIAITGCFEGLQVKGDSLDVGKKTTKSVVESIFMVIVLDAVFSIIFTKLGI